VFGAVPRPSLALFSLTLATHCRRPQRVPQLALPLGPLFPPPLGASRDLAGGEEWWGLILVLDLLLGLSLGPLLCL